MFQVSFINVRPRFAGFPCQTLSEGGNAQRSKPRSGHIQGKERKTGLTEPICNAFGGITHPCCHVPHTAAINGPFISPPAMVSGDRASGAGALPAGKAAGSRYGRPDKRKRECGPCARFLFDGGKERVEGVRLKQWRYCMDAEPIHDPYPFRRKPDVVHELYVEPAIKQWAEERAAYSKTADQLVIKRTNPRPGEAG